LKEWKEGWKDMRGGVKEINANHQIKNEEA